MEVKQEKKSAKFVDPFLNAKVRRPGDIQLSEDQKTVILLLENGYKLSFERKDGSVVSSDEMKKIMDIISKEDFNFLKDLKRNLGKDYNLKSFTGNGKLFLYKNLDSKLFGMDFASDFKLENITVKEGCGIIFNGEKITLNNVKFEKQSGLHVKNAKDVVISNCEFPLHRDNEGKITSNVHAFMISGLSESLNINDSCGMINQKDFLLRLDGDIHGKNRGMISFTKTGENEEMIELGPEEIMKNFRGSLLKKGYVKGLKEFLSERKERFKQDIESVSKKIEAKKKRLLRLHKWTVVKEKGIKGKLKGIIKFVARMDRQFEKTKSELIKLENKGRYKEAVVRNVGVYEKVGDLEIEGGNIKYTRIDRTSAPKANGLPALKKTGEILAARYNWINKFFVKDESFFKIRKEKIFEKLYKDERKNNEDAKIYKLCCDVINKFFKGIVSNFNEEYGKYKENLKSK